MKTRAMIIGVLTALLLAARALPARADERFALIVSGVSGATRIVWRSAITG
jgi:hypothetical protein